MESELATVLQKLEKKAEMLHSFLQKKPVSMQPEAVFLRDLLQNDSQDELVEQLTSNAPTIDLRQTSAP